MLRSLTVQFPRCGLLNRARDDLCHATRIVLRLDVLRLDVSWLDYIVEIPIVFMSCDSCHCSPHVLIPGLRAPVSGIH